MNTRAKTSMNSDFLVSVVIPTYNRKKSAERLIRSLLVSSYKNLEIIVIDDASKDATKDYLMTKFRKNEQIKIFRNKKNLFAAASKNEGQKRAKGKYVMFIDDDNVVDEEMISELVAKLDSSPNVGEVAPINYDFNEKKKLILTRSTRSMWTTKTTHLRTLAPFKGQDSWEADDAPNAYMIRANVILKNKINFRSDYGIMYEESDYAYRIRRAGYRIMMVKKAKIYHDIEEKQKNEKPKDYLYHFMEDERRPFTFARNRIVFHNIFSTKFQNLLILIFWIWFFSIYYSYKFIFYSGYGSFGARQKFSAAFNYIKGTFSGLAYLAKG